jgi:hypothetical protein
VRRGKAPKKDAPGRVGGGQSWAMTMRSKRAGSSGRRDLAYRSTGAVSAWIRLVLRLSRLAVSVSGACRAMASPWQAGTHITAWRGASLRRERSWWRACCGEFRCKLKEAQSQPNAFAVTFCCLRGRWWRGRRRGSAVEAQAREEATYTHIRALYGCWVGGTRD